MIFKIFLLISLVSSFLGMILIVKRSKNQNKNVEKNKSENILKKFFHKLKK